MIAVEKARAILRQAVEPLPTESVGLPDAYGRVLSEPIRADRDFPPTDRSAMDGYAVRTADLPEADRVLRVVGEVRAGQAVGDTAVGEGQAVRIMTGAIVPPGADAVVMVELTEPGDAPDTVRVREAPRKDQHIRFRGEDLRSGGEVVPAGVPIHAAEIAALASVGRMEVPSYRVPDVRVLSTGDEVVEPHVAPQDHQIRNSNASMLMAQLRALAVDGAYLGIAPDDPDGLRDALRRGLEGDVLLLTGGVSMGAYDLVGVTLDELGVERLFHKVSMRPGKPILAARAGTCLALGLPGNPVSAFTGFTVFAAPVIRRMMGYRRWDLVDHRAELVAPLRPKPGRTTYHLARLELDDGRLTAEPVRTMGSGDVLSMARANGFLVSQPGKASLQPGTRVPALLWPETIAR